MATRGYENTTAKDLQRMHAAPVGAKPSKYRNVKVEADGFTFDSRHEADVWMLLRAREKAGDITQLRRQVPFTLYVPMFGKDGESLNMNAALMTYVADFQFLDKSGQRVVMDAKGQKRRICPYPLKAKAMALSYGITIEEV